jgi:hypothetical protein
MNDDEGLGDDDVDGADGCNHDAAYIVINREALCYEARVSFTNRKMETAATRGNHHEFKATTIMMHSRCRGITAL